MRKRFYLLFTVYLMFAAGFGGWRGRDLWSDWVVWCLLLPPLAWCGLQAIHERQGGGPIEVPVVMGVIAFVTIGASGLGIAWVIAEATEKFSASPAVRACIGAALGAAVGGLTLLPAKSQKAAELRQESVSESTGGPAESGSATDGGARFVSGTSSSPVPRR
jgi:hypothetical protein